MLTTPNVLKTFLIIWFAFVLVFGSEVHRTSSRILKTARLRNIQAVIISQREEKIEAGNNASTRDFKFLNEDWENDDDEILEERQTFSHLLPPITVTVKDADGNIIEDEYNSRNKAMSLSVNDCGSPGAIITKSTISGCIGNHCLVRRGSPINVTVTFVAKSSSANMWCHIVAEKGSFHKRIECPHTDLCNVPELNCPLVSNKQYTINVSAVLSPRIPKGRWHLMGTISDDRGTIICISAYATVL